VSGASATAPDWATAGLTDEQRAAVARRVGEVSLSAAAGSGKTSVLVERFVSAVREDGVAPARILAITFTERAAGELRERARARLLELGERQLARDTEAAFVGTFHGFCARLLRSHPLAAGIEPQFTILDEGLAEQVRAEAFGRALAGFLAQGPPAALDLVAAYRVDLVASIVNGVHAELRSRGAMRPRLPPVPPGELDADGRDAARACELFDDLLARFDEAYESLKARRGALDFDDLELRAAALLSEHAGVRGSWGQRFELLMVDEFQDTNARQLGILRSLARANLFTVGDEFQSIYGFRHADVRLFRERMQTLEPAGASLALTRNFRSRARLLESVNTAFAGRLPGFVMLRPGREREPDEGEAAVELLLTDRCGWEEREDAPGGGGAQPWRRAEASFLAARIAELVEQALARPGEVVVLLRAMGDLEAFERALQLRGLRTIAAAGAFWGHQQIADLIAYLRVLANPLDELALHSALASPLAGCSPDGLVLLARLARSRRTSVWAAALTLEQADAQQRLDARDEAAIEAFCALVRRERATAATRTISQLIEGALAGSGYREHVLGLDWGERRLANIHKLLRLARRFQALEGRDLRAFLDHVAHLQRGRGREPDAPVEGVEPDAVRLMTIHAAKGLEFPVVCVADLGRSPNLHTPELLLDGPRVGLRLRRLDGGDSVPALDYEELCSERREREAQEEDRILYVAMTRARERLLLSGAVDFSSWPPSRRTPISWVAPALAPDLPEMLQAGELPARLTLGAGSAAVVCLLNRPTASDGEQHAAAHLGPDLTAEQGRHHAPPAGPARTSPDSTRVLARGPQPPSALSYSSLSELERCGYRFYLERVVGLPEDRAAVRSAGRGGLDPRERGTLVHRLMEGVEMRSARAPSRARIDALIAERGLRVDEQERRELELMLQGAVTSAAARRIAAGTIVGAEQSFALTLGQHEPLLTGVIDLLVEEPDGNRLVVDYKSDRVAADADLQALVTAEYEIQRMLYALAVLDAGAASVEVMHWFLARPKEPASAFFTLAQREQLERAIRALTARAVAGGYAVSQAPHRALCGGCPGRGGLCSWEEAATLHERPPAADAPVAVGPDEPLTLF
jgi:ATP-dependent helicase/nuclease subunit A